jgi:uncharacterized protein YndB with AHSA1/START domain
MRTAAEFDAPIDRVWQVWADPRQLERWWGPPTHPATVVDHDLTPGGKVTDFMTGPEGDRYHGWWQILTVDPPRHIEVIDGFADETGAVNNDMPTTTMRVTLASLSPARTAMEIESKFASLEAMEALVAMGMEQGMMEALGQIEGILQGA